MNYNSFQLLLGGPPCLRDESSSYIAKLSILTNRLVLSPKIIYFSKEEVGEKTH